MRDSGARRKTLSCPRVIPALLIAKLLIVLPAGAQSWDHFNPLSDSLNGFHLYGVSVAGMHSVGYGAGSELGLPIPPQLSTGSVTTIQASASFGLVRNIGKSSLRLNYSPSYVHGLRSSNLESTNHTLLFSVSRTLTPKWQIAGSVNGILTDFDQLMFAGSRSIDIATTPATFDEFAAAILTGRSTNPSITQAVNAAPIVTSPELAFLYGGRLLSVAATASASYAYSTRSALTFSINTARTQFFNRGGNVYGKAADAYSIPWTTTAIPTLNWGYSLSPRTTITANVSTNRTMSRYQDAYATQANVSLGRTMSDRWFLQGSVGTGWIKPLRQSIPLNQRPQLTYSGSIGVKMYAQTLFGGFSRSVADMYGLGANTSDVSSVGWAWKRPGSSISLTSSFGYSRLRNPAFSNTGSFTGSISGGKTLTAQMALSVSYSYLQLPTTIVTNASNLTRSGVIVSLSWSPSERR
jgi:hypothetical protein